MLVPSDSQRRFLEEASRTYHKQLTEAEDAVEYLTGPQRGLSEEIIERFRLGVVNDPLPGHEKYRGRIVIPYLTSSGPVTLRFRRFRDEGPKYLSPPGDPPRIFNPPALERGSRAICVAEGEFDAMVAEMCGLPCIGIPGADAWRPLWAKLLGQYESVFLLQDEGEAGQAMADTMAKSLGHILRPVVMTPDDTTGFYLKHGREELRKKVGANG